MIELANLDDLNNDIPVDSFVSRFSGTDLDELQSKATILDEEGRCIMTDHVTFCLLNAYFPAIRTNTDGKPDEERLQLKEWFNKAYECCLYDIHIRQKRDVIMVGDFNISAAFLDSQPKVNDEPSPFGDWLRELVQNHRLVDTFKMYHPTRQEAFTCWSQLTGGRMTNYGSRIDFILTPESFAKDQSSHCDIRPDFKGSDHCPVIVDLRGTAHPPVDQIPSCPPPSCACHLPEARIQQTSLLDYCSQRSKPPSRF